MVQPAETARAQRSGSAPTMPQPPVPFNVAGTAGPPIAKVARTVKEWRSDRPHLVVAMAGLPARGKTYIARRIARYLSWMGVQNRWYNVGNHRRQVLGAGQPNEWFDPSNEEATRIRSNLALQVLDMMIDEMTNKGVEVGVFDATNTTLERRAELIRRCHEANIELLFVELICYDPEIIAHNIRETKLTSPDYFGKPADEIVHDFLLRIAHYERAYQTLTEDIPYIKYVDVGRQVVLNRIKGYLPSHICFYITHLHTTPRPLYLSRHGESEFNTREIIGGDSDLSENGRMYAQRLGKFMQLKAHRDLVCFTSTLRRTRETARLAALSSVQWAALDELNAGTCDSMTYEDIRVAYPGEYAARQQDKLRYRYPRGESYEDVIERLETVILELERSQSPVLVIGHQAVNRALLAYFRSLAVDECPILEVPLHCVIELVPKAYGCEERHYYLDRDDVENIESKLVNVVKMQGEMPITGSVNISNEL
eukprot:TRINITY_DN4216_c0_g1_i1.p1 TRINITY_DN4216_c0_g1~~TRINITY_DN4216_c0_g1_i1.p1  ORF type:complete len:482 (+),score=81.30 TRINITY_DN4216_c0_g1_i1:80-1525(+)